MEAASEVVPARHLAQLVATMPGWITNTVTQTELNLGGGGGYSFQTTESLLAQFDKHVKEARAAIANCKDPDYSVPWSLNIGGRVVMTQPRGAVVRQHFNHLCHHRASSRCTCACSTYPFRRSTGPRRTSGGQDRKALKLDCHPEPLVVIPSPSLSSRAQ